MTRAVFFDWFNTLTTYSPPRENTYIAACRDLGLHVTSERLSRGLLLADHFYSDENARFPIKQREPKEMIAVYVRYGQVVLRGAGLPDDEETVLRVMERVRGAFNSARFALYDDVIPALAVLKSRGVAMGLISNIDQDIRPVCHELGLDPYVSHVVTSKDVGSEKPRLPIFLAALDGAGVEAAESVYVGDQYSCDVVGARGVGMKPVLVDRYDLFPEIRDCVRVRSLGELVNHL
ncbi:MAG: HAD-IA family hydrolase [Dehalococcoidia bacterium]|nr:HAD-IA family hydrolase [Dehalococcoidia bacterium]